MMAKHEITAADIMPVAEYGKIRRAHRQELIARKKHRRLEVGPLATFYFENYDTMWSQIHEMLWIEKGGEEQVADELDAYNPLIPKGRELVATMMFEIDDPRRRAQVLSRLGQVEETVTLRIGDETVTAVPEMQDGVERTKADGKTSSIHFLHFPLTDAQAEKFRAADTEVILGVGHENYAHMAVMPKAMRAELSRDLD